MLSTQTHVQNSKAAKETATTSSTSHHNLFAACLPRWLDNAQLTEIFADFHPLNATVMMDVNSGRSKGFGFVLFRTNEEGERAMTALNGKPVSCAGTTFAMHLSPSKYDGVSACTESTRIYLRNIPISTTSEMLMSFFSRFGTVKALELRPDTRRSSWLVTLEFDSIAEARAAIGQSHGRYLFAGPPQLPAPVMAKFAETVEIKAQRRHRRSSDRNSSTGSATAVPRQHSPPPYDPSCGLSDTGSTGSRPPSPPAAEDLTPAPARFRHEPYGSVGFVLVAVA